MNLTPQRMHKLLDGFEEVIEASGFEHKILPVVILTYINDEDRVISAVGTKITRKTVIHMLEGCIKQLQQEENANEAE